MQLRPILTFALVGITSTVLLAAAVPQATPLQLAGPHVPAGTILAFAGDNVPNGFLLCDGSELKRDDQPRLFAAIGEAWGAQTSFTFTLPDLRGRFLRGVDGGAGNDPNSLMRAAIAPGGNTGDAVGSLQADGRKGFGGNFSGSTNSAGTHEHDILTRQDDWDEDDGDSSRHSAGWADDARSPVPWEVFHKTEPDGSHSHSFTLNVTFAGENETRPKNAYVKYIIKT